MFDLPDRDIAELQDSLLHWFAAVKRPLPWRTRRTLYGTWISEIMLQQTTVATVLPYWQRFMDRFPDVRALAQASEAEVLAQWSGLGYYRRARHLHQAAQQIVAAGGGLPGTRADWAALPGVGAYASGAIASQALGERVPALDANAKRVLTRWLVGDPAHLARWKPRLLAESAERLVPADQPGSWNEAVMELGALVCQARQPDCPGCPVLPLCRAGLAGMADLIPAQSAVRESQPVKVGLLVARHQGRILLVPQGHPPLLRFNGNRRVVREDFTQLHQGLWGLPGTAWVSPDSGRGAWSLNLGGEFRSRLANFFPGQKPRLTEGIKEVGEFRHAVTRYRLQVLVHLLDLPIGKKHVEVIEDNELAESSGPGGPTSPGASPSHWPLVADTGKWPLSGLATKALRLLGDNFG